MADELKSTGWVAMAEAPDMVKDISGRASPPLAGQYVCKIYPLPVGWVVLKYQSGGDLPESYFLLPEAPHA